jgi:C4-dicarboxylate-specific signal transduction histidine kinase
VRSPGWPTEPDGREQNDALPSAQTGLPDQELAWAILDALPSQVALLDRLGNVLQVNQAWRAFALRHGNVHGTVWPGLHYVDACIRARLSGVDGAPVRDALRALAADGTVVLLEYEQTIGLEERWFELRLQRLPEPPGGALAVHLEVTARKRAELQAVDRLHELAHFSRAATMGALAGSAAHELNQPLTAILSNAQAALRFLTMQPPRTDLVREILEDIAAADQRAGEIIRRIRRLLRKGDPEERSTLDLNEVVQEALYVVADEGLLRKVRMDRQLEPELPRIRGDFVQLQQVVLNLVLNAFDAMDELAAHDRQLSVRTASAGGQAVQLVVQDQGPGVDERQLQRIFEPFFTTKRNGLGMGLFITRAIVDSHGGQVKATRAEPRGLRVCITLPLPSPGSLAGCQCSESEVL